MSGDVSGSLGAPARPLLAFPTVRLPITPPEAARVRTRDLLRRLIRLPVTAAYRAETGLRNLLARTATDRGWTAAVIPYAGYARGRHARILGRVLLAPADVDPAAQRGVPGWRRLLTLERPGADLEVELAEDRIAIAIGPGGLIDTVVTSAKS